ncbi:MAG: DUF5652 family protein [Nanoarchaeota archaeon]|nr:DUF5652 family protein [Nanoarchaeota archaeon]
MALLYWLYQHPSVVIASLILLSLWELVWKGIALWYASRNRQKKWFVALLVINSVGVLPIIYLRWCKPKKKEFVIGKRETPKKNQN